MARFLVRSVISTVITMLLVSVLLFLLIQVGSGDITVKILGVFATEEQRASYAAQLGLDAPLWQQYVDWLIGNDWRAQAKVGHPLVAVIAATMHLAYGIGLIAGLLRGRKRSLPLG